MCGRQSRTHITMSLQPLKCGRLSGPPLPPTLKPSTLAASSSARARACDGLLAKRIAGMRANALWLYYLRAFCQRAISPGMAKRCDEDRRRIVVAPATRGIGLEES